MKFLPMVDPWVRLVLPTHTIHSHDHVFFPRSLVPSLIPRARGFSGILYPLIIPILRVIYVFIVAIPLKSFLTVIPPYSVSSDLIACVIFVTRSVAPLQTMNVISMENSSMSFR